MMRFLLVYELVPEETRFYLLDVEDEETQSKLMGCHKNIGNTVGCDVDLDDWLSLYLEGKKHEDLSVPLQIDGRILIHSGFLL